MDTPPSPGPPGPLEGTLMSDADPMPQVGWQVLDPDGNVIASGPVTELEMAAGLGETVNLEGTDGGD